ncbi:MAG TPA: glycosyltransferase, partial [Candidatus Tumulicola sp.]|nr:glycosyltransferase [Candidatus Tumulicola sp.]
MPDALPRPAGVAVVPCFNEGSNPIGISRALLEIPDLTVAFVDDASDAPSREVLDSLAGRDARVRVVRN